MPKYKWNSPLEWLEETIKDGRWDDRSKGGLCGEILTLARLLDSDQLQDEYQNLMDEDGYYDVIVD